MMVVEFWRKQIVKAKVEDAVSLGKKADLVEEFLKCAPCRERYRESLDEITLAAAVSRKMVAGYPLEVQVRAFDSPDARNRQRITVAQNGRQIYKLAARRSGFHPFEVNRKFKVKLFPGDQFQFGIQATGPKGGELENRLIFPPGFPDPGPQGNGSVMPQVMWPLRTAEPYLYYQPLAVRSCGVEDVASCFAGRLLMNQVDAKGGFLSAGAPMAVSKLRSGASSYYIDFAVSEKAAKELRAFGDYICPGAKWGALRNSR